MTPAAQTKEVISFGPFSLIASERLLTRGAAPVELGARALDILMALLSRPNEVVSKSDLLAQVWPDVTVEEGSLRFHIANLRKALGDGKDGARYITTLAGRGYCFVAPISRSSDREPLERVAAAAAASFPHANLPGRLIGMVGRDDDVLKLSAQLNATRFVTIVGSGGVGKTTVAVAVGHHLIEAFAGAVLFVDLGMLSDPGLVATAVASMLGLSVQSDDATPSLIAYLRDKRILLILDTCEHLIEAVAALASTHLRGRAASPHPGDKSRGSSGRGRARLQTGSACLSTGRSGLTAAVAQTFPAPKLFVERAVASGARLDFSDAEAAIVVGICRKLDGVALAIELAARRVEAYGLQQTAALLDQRLTLLWLGPRTAPPRQKTLQATLDWSYGLLSELERAGASPARGIRRAFYARCGAGGRDQRDPRSSGRFRRHRQPRRQVDGRDPPHRGHDALPAAGHDARLRPRNRASTTPNSPTWPCATRPTIGDGWSRPGPNGRPCRPGRNGHPTLPVSTMSAPRWNGALASTAMLKSASDLPPPPRPFSWRCLCSPNVIAGRSGRFSLSTMLLAVGPRRCIFRRRSDCR